MGKTIINARCACRDCLEIAVSTSVTSPELCDDCDCAGCGTSGTEDCEQTGWQWCDEHGHSCGEGKGRCGGNWTGEGRHGGRT